MRRANDKMFPTLSCPDHGRRVSCSHLRGAPSAISTAVMPSDHRSLCRDTERPIKLPHSSRPGPATLSLFLLSVPLLRRSRSDSPDPFDRSLFPKPPHLEVISGVRVLVTGDDLRSHPVRCPDEGVPAAHRAIQLSAHSKVN